MDPATDKMATSAKSREFPIVHFGLDFKPTGDWKVSNEKEKKEKPLKASYVQTHSFQF